MLLSCVTAPPPPAVALTRLLSTFSSALELVCQRLYIGQIHTSITTTWNPLCRFTISFFYLFNFLLVFLIHDITHSILAEVNTTNTIRNKKTNI